MQQELKGEEFKVEVDLSHIVNCYVNNYKPKRKCLRKHNTLKKLRCNNDIVVLKPDEGNCVVVMNRKDYNTVILTIINDISKFKLLTEDPTQKRENHLKRALRNLKKKGFIDSKVYGNIYLSGLLPARIYGTPKMHKLKVSDKTPSFRPIVSSIGTCNYIPTC